MYQANIHRYSGYIIVNCLVSLCGHLDKMLNVAVVT
jgi:hypothetical protein